MTQTLARGARWVSIFAFDLLRCRLSAHVLMKTIDIVAERGEGGDAAVAASRPHGKGDVAPQNPAAKRMADPAAGIKQPAKKRRRGPHLAPERPPAPMVPG